MLFSIKSHGDNYRKTSDVIFRRKKYWYLHLKSSFLDCIFLFPANFIATHKGNFVWCICLSGGIHFHKRLVKVVAMLKVKSNQDQLLCWWHMFKLITILYPLPSKWPSSSVHLLVTLRFSIITSTVRVMLLKLH